MYLHVFTVTFESSSLLLFLPIPSWFLPLPTNSLIDSSIYSTAMAASLANRILIMNRGLTSSDAVDVLP